jgi:riboflavin kinase/FMN adenylyltransferase
VNVWNGLGALPEDVPPVVASIGNFDGVHLGHREILRRVVADARERRARALLVTFEPHPAAIVAPDRRPKLIDTRMQKIDRLAECGLSDLLIVRFDRELAALGGKAFLELLEGYGLCFAAVHVGENFRFGHDRAGDLALLREIGERRGFAVHGVPAISLDGRTLSSSEIRRALEAGEVGRAAAMLGRPWELIGEVVPGAGRGRELDCPTANIEPANELLPGIGVYVTETVALAARTASVTNVGRRPTVGGGAVVVETHQLVFDDDL